ncbi:MAG: class I SAM-dependent methyltransferase [Magnetococcales bacterium]|nr:class I SAM-dependent methyltransferase [Magnetococcales bacterium]MBF0439101.1 class I SAM-dependent methyltransferase [Magnetococcales bacterium]
MNCRHCNTPIKHLFLDLGYAPPSNAYRTREELKTPERHFPLKVLVCHHCWLVQTEDFCQADELFGHDYAYFSSTSTSWLTHAARYAQEMIERLFLNTQSFVIELAANDGYLLKNFLAAGIPCLGVEPTESTANAARKLGIPILMEFFGLQLGQRLAANGQQADLLIGNNVYAHVPDINDFTQGMQALLKPGGTITLEFPHLLRLIEQAQFDTVYHEHFSYLSLHTVGEIFRHAGLKIYDVEALPTHGGSLRLFGCHANDPRPVQQTVHQLLAKEESHGLRTLQGYQTLQARAEQIRDDLLLFLIEQKRAGKRVAAYGAAAKGNTLLNFAGIKPDLLPFVCDAAPSKQGKFMPGSHIPIRPPSALHEHPLDYLILLPWNIATELMQKHASLTTRGTRFVTLVPELAIL